MNEIARALPAGGSLEQIRDALARNDPWFYEFRFSNGATTKASNDLVELVHRTRAEMIFPLLDDLFGDRWPATRCLDVACNEGWFSTQLAARGATQVTGVDIRAEHIRKATVIRDLSSLGNLAFERRDILDITPESHGIFDVTLLLGLLYHVENPLAILRAVRVLTRRLCAIETQVARATATMECHTVGPPGVRRGAAVALVPANEAHVEPGKSLVMVPTLEALYAMLRAVGFARTYLVVPPSHAYEQFLQYDRVVVFAM